MRIGFLGLGMVAYVYGSALHQADAAIELWGYDVRYASDPDMFKQRFSGIPVHFAASDEELAQNTDMIFSTVTTNVAVSVAEHIAPFLKKEQYYIDMNSMEPNRKIEAADKLKDRCRFVEAAVLGAVGATGAKTKILLCGDYAQETAEYYAGLGLNTHFFGTEIGKASLFKMVRSVFSKGLETLIIEMMEAAKKAGLYEEVWNDICDFMASKSFKAIGENWVKTHATAAVRREAEMEQVGDTLRYLGVEPVMTEASVKVFQKSVEKNIEDTFRTAGAYEAKDVIDFLNR